MTDRNDPSPALQGPIFEVTESILIYCDGGPSSHRGRRTIQIFAKLRGEELTLGWSAQRITQSGQELTLISDRPMVDKDWIEAAARASENRGAGGNPPLDTRRKYLLDCKQCSMTYFVRHETLMPILDGMVTRGENQIAMSELGAILSK